MTKLMPSERHSIWRRFAIVAVRLRPSTLTVISSPTLSPSALGDPGSKETSGLPRSPAATTRRRRASTLRDLVGVGDAAVAVEHPGDLLVRLDLCDRHAAQARRAARASSARARSARRALPAPGRRRRPRPGRSGCRGRRSSAPVRAGSAGELPGEVRIDHGEGHEERDAEAERQDEGGRQRAGRWRLASARRGAARRGRGRRRATAMMPARDEPQQREGAGRRGDEDQRDLAVIGGENRKADEGATESAERDEIASARPAPLRIDLIAEQARRPARRGRARAAPARRRAPSAHRRAARRRVR